MTRYTLVELRDELLEDHRVSDEQKINRVTKLRDEAIDYLKPLIKDVSRDMYSNVRSAYAKKGISTKWDESNLQNCDNALAFVNAVNTPQTLPDGAGRMASDLRLRNKFTSSQKSAVDLLEYCSMAIKMNTLPDDNMLAQYILSAYAGIDNDKA